MKESTLPRLIALCGKPGSGKSLAADLLAEAHGYRIHDDGGPLRAIAMDYFGCSESDVFTQAGKKREIRINGRTITVRQLLGEIGEAFEEKFGANMVPQMSANAQDPRQRYVIPSVRHDQGYFWKEMGALVVEIDRPGTPNSPFPFDRYSRGAVDVTVRNTPSPEETDRDRLDFLEELVRSIRNSGVA
jgi:hypothetical protein